MKKFFAMLACAVAASTLNAWTVAGPEKPTTPEKTAVSELQDYLSKTVRTEITVDGKPAEFLVGDTPEAAKLGWSSAKLKDEEWRIKSDGGRVILVGGGSRGTLYAVYNFIERHLGARWWNPVEEYVPPKSDIALARLDESGRPAFLYRDIYISHCPQDNGRFAARNRLNRFGDWKFGAEYGGSFNYGPPYFVHTFSFYIPADKYFKDHPEYFALRDGKRRPTQICLTNPDLPGIVSAKLRENILAAEKKAAADGVPAPRMYSISQNDDWDFCKCPECEKVVAEEGAPSGLLLRFVNKVAKDAAEFRPGVLIDTLAYYQNEEPPKLTHPADNVIIRLCGTRFNLTAACDEKDNKLFLGMLKDWARVAPQLSIWHYAITYTGFCRDPYGSILPLPENHMAEMLRTFAANRVSGVFFEHENFDRADMHTMKMYLECKLMENPAADFDALVLDFTDKYYGPAGKHVREYRALVRQAALRNKPVILYDGSLLAYRYVDKECMEKSQAAFDLAEKAVAGDTVLTDRVRRARMGIDAIYALNDERYRQLGLDKSAVVGRIVGAWEEQLRKLGVKTVPLPLQDFKLQREMVGKNLPVPGELHGRRIVSFNADTLGCMAGDTIKVADKDAAGGHAARIIPSDKRFFSWPFQCGTYDTINKKHGLLRKIESSELPPGGGYKIYKLFRYKPQVGTYLWVTDAWWIQVWLEKIADEDKEFDIYISMKLEGPRFVQGSEGQSAIYVDRVIAAEVGSKD